MGGHKVKEGRDQDAAGPSNRVLELQVQSAMGASLIAALATTPFDVVKTRQQILSPADSIWRCLEASRRAFSPRAMASIEVCGCTGPATTLKATVDKSLRPTAYQVMNCMLKTEGMFSVFRGTGFTVVHSIPSIALYLILYEQLKDRLRKSGSLQHSIVPVVAGSAARSVSVFLTSPLELIRTRIMAQNGTAVETVGWAKVLRQTVKNEGWISLCKGVVPTLYRDVPFSALYWFMAEYTRDTISASLAHNHQQGHPRLAGGDSPSMERVLVINLASGVLAGGAATVVTHPFDVIKTRSQVDMSVGSSSLRKGTLATLSDMLAKDGFMSLWSGVGPRALKVAPSCAIVLGSFEAFKRFFV